MLVTTSLLTSKNDPQLSVNNFWACLLDNQTAMQRRRPIIILSAAFMGKNASDNIATASSFKVFIFNFTTMHAMSHRSDCDLACSSEVNIWELAFYPTTTYPLTVTQIELPRIQFPTAMSDTKSLNTSLLEVLISSSSGCILIREFSNLNLHIIFDAWWALKNLGSKRPMAWNNSTHTPSWQFYLHCWIEEIGSPGIICIDCHQVLRHASEHGTSSMGQHVLANAYIAKVNEFTVSEVTELTSSTVDETALAILKSQESRGIPIVSLQRKIIFTI